MKISEFGFKVGNGITGKKDSISDIKGVKVGHFTIKDDNHNTGVTIVIPSDDNAYLKKFPAAFYSANGFGKMCGSIQVDELGTIETPIALTNTLNVGIVSDAIVSYMIEVCRKDGYELKTVNPIVGECNDHVLNDITSRVVSESEVFSAIESASEDFEEGSVGAGTGTSCFGLKGGIGTASRIVLLDDKKYTVGILCQTNFGKIKDLTVCGKKIDSDVANSIDDSSPDKGSCIVIMATDLPLSDRQIKRVLKRCSVGLVRTGSYLGNGSGEIYIGFSVSNRVQNECSDKKIYNVDVLNESYIDDVFRAAAEATEEAILNSLISAETVTNKYGVTRHSLKEFIKDLK